MGFQNHQISAVATIEITPPITMVLDAPINPAQVPTQIVPTLFAVWAARIIKANERPRMWSGVVNITVVRRTATVTASAAPSKAIINTPNHNVVAVPNPNRKKP